MIVVHSGKKKIHDVSERSLASLDRAYLKLSLMYLKRLCLANATWVIWKNTFGVYVCIHKSDTRSAGYSIDNNNLHCCMVIHSISLNFAQD